RRIGISSESLAGYEAGRSPLPWEIGDKICRLLNVNQRWLLNGSGRRDGHYPISISDERDQLAECRGFSEAFEHLLKGQWGQLVVGIESILTDERYDRDQHWPTLLEMDEEEEGCLRDIVRALRMSQVFTPQPQRIAYYKYLR